MSVGVQPKISKVYATVRYNHCRMAALEQKREKFSLNVYSSTFELYTQVKVTQAKLLRMQLTYGQA